jgi:hypothetical protein
MNSPWMNIVYSVSYDNILTDYWLKLRRIAVRVNSSNESKWQSQLKEKFIKFRKWILFVRIIYTGESFMKIQRIKTVI